MKNKKKLNKKRILKVIISIIILSLSLVCFKYIKNMNILPNKYLYLFLSIILVLNLISALLLFIKGIISKIFSGILYLILGIISVIGIKYAGNTIEFLNKGFNNNIEYTVYNVIISNDSTYTSLKDLNQSKMGYFFIDIDNYDYLEAIKQKVDVELEQLGLAELYDGLLNNKIDSILINEGYISLLEEEYEDFSKKTKVLDLIKVEKKVENNNELDKMELALSLAYIIA